MDSAKKVISPGFLGGGLCLILAISPSCKGPEPQSPNIIFIFADDLGYGDLGCYGQTKIETPNIDRLAAEGMRFTDHYSGSPICAPSRYILLSGIHSGRAQIRGNDEGYERGDIWNYYAMLADSSLEGQSPMREGTITIGTMLQSKGYKTAAIGKWGLGPPGSEGVPNKQGFDFFYGYLCQRQAHTYYPVHLWKNDQRVYLGNDTLPPHTPLPGHANPYDKESYLPFSLNAYSPDLMLDEIMQFVKENRANPFFLYWATPIPHLPLQAPQRWIDYYAEKFGNEEPYRGRPERAGYTPARYPNATYAAMISFLDEQVGLLVEKLKDLGIYENTLIFFSSDNGPSGFYTPYFESAAPFRTEAGYIKGSLHEGGIRVPLIASWPGVIKPGSVSDHICALYDFFPTIADLTGFVATDTLSGISFLPELKGQEQKVHDFLYWEFPQPHENLFWKFPPVDGQMAVRIGKYKALRKAMHQGNMEWAVYNLEEDPKELVDISSLHPDIISRVDEIIKSEHTLSEKDLWRFRVLGEK